MLLEEAIYNEIIADATLAPKITIAGSPVTYHLYPLHVPVGIAEFTKALTYTEIAQNLIHPMGRQSRIQISCIARKYLDALSLAEDINRIFNDKNDYMLGGGFYVSYIKFEGRSALFDDSASMYIVPVDLLINYKK